MKLFHDHHETKSFREVRFPECNDWYFLRYNVLCKTKKVPTRNTFFNFHGKPSCKIWRS
jgi:hypothetical protein